MFAYNVTVKENIGRPLSDINHSIIFLNLSSSIMEIKAKINKWGLLKLKNFCTAKETINKMKRQPTDWEKIFANDVTDKGLVSKINKELMTLNSIKTRRRQWHPTPVLLPGKSRGLRSLVGCSPWGR